MQGESTEPATLEMWVAPPPGHPDGQTIDSLITSSPSQGVQFKQIQRYSPEKIRQVHEYVAQLLRSGFVAPMPFPFFEKVFELPAKSYIHPQASFEVTKTTYGYFTKHAAPGMLSRISDQTHFLGYQPGFPMLFNRYPDQVFIYYDGTSSRPVLDGYEVNKIHLWPKDEYMLYTIMKLDRLITGTFMREFPHNGFRMKFTFNQFMDRKYGPGETLYHGIPLNGGFAPMIVLYGSGDNKIMAWIIEQLQATFKGEDDIIGYLDLTNPRDNSPFNMRVSPLITYAAGDRVETLGEMERVRDGKYPNPEAAGYRIPQWLLDKQATCGTDQAGTNAMTQALIGFDVCADNAPIDLQALCASGFDEMRKFCFLERTKKSEVYGVVMSPPLDPTPFYNVYKGLAPYPAPRYAPVTPEAAAAAKAKVEKIRAQEAAEAQERVARAKANIARAQAAAKAADEAEAARAAKAAAAAAGIAAQESGAEPAAPAAAPAAEPPGPAAPRKRSWGGRKRRATRRGRRARRATRKD